MIVSILARSVYDDRSNQDIKAVRSARQTARLQGPVQKVSVEEFALGENGKADVLKKSEHSWYSKRGARVRYERDSLYQDESSSGELDPEEATTQLDTGQSLNEYGFRLLSPSRSVLDPRRVRYAFEIFNLHRFEAFYYDEGGALGGKSVHHDFSDGKRRYISISRYSPEGNHDSSELTVFNRRGDVEEQIKRNREGRIFLHWTYAYDEQGNLIEMTSLDNEGKPMRKVTFSYIYDEMGNWIERTTYGFMMKSGVESTFIPQIVTKRKITYYSGR